MTHDPTPLPEPSGPDAPSGTAARSEADARERAAEWGSPGAHGWRITAPPLSWAILLITTTAILMTSIDGELLNRAMPTIAQEFGLDQSDLGWINAMFFLGFVVGAYTFGVISDRIGSGYRRTWPWNVAMLIAVLGGALTWGFTGSFAALLLFRLPLGVSRGGSEPVNVAIVSEWWPKEHRGFALGVHHTGFPLGQFVVGPVLVAIYAMGVGWRGAFLLVPLLGLVAVVLQTVVGRKANQQRVYDRIDEQGLTRPTPDLSVQTREPVLSQILVAFRNHNARWVMLLAFVLLWAEAGVVSFLTVQLTQNGLSTNDAVVIAGASGLTGWFGQVLWGTLSDHIGRKPALGFIVAGWALAVAAMYFISSPALGWIVLLGWGLFRNAPFPVIYAVLTDSVPKASASAMGVLIGTALGVSGMLASVVAGYVIQDFGWGAHYTLLVALLLLGYIPVARLRETVHRRSVPAT